MIETTEVFDPDFKFVVKVPSSFVVHLPPESLNITRLVLCRNYVPGVSSSCAMGANCKFVHVDTDVAGLPSYPIHVKYSYRHENLCKYPRLPAGKTLLVTHHDGHKELVPSERVLVTRGSLRYVLDGATFSSCTHFCFLRMCKRGERCNFVHVVYVDGNVCGNFRRAPVNRSTAGDSGARRPPPSKRSSNSSFASPTDSTSAESSSTIRWLRWYSHDPYFGATSGFKKWFAHFHTSTEDGNATE